MYRRTEFLKVWEDDPGKAREMFKDAMERTGGSVPKTAKALKMSRVTAYRYLRADPALARHRKELRRTIARAAAERLAP